MKDKDEDRTKLSIKIQKNVLEKLNYIADYEGVSKNSLIEKYIEKYLNNYEKISDGE